MGDEGTARNLILDAAVRVLQDEGPAKLTQTRVAKAAGLRQGHLTYYFPRKSDLWVATAQHAQGMLQAELGQFFENDTWTSAGEDHRARMVALVSHLVKDKQRTRLMLSLALQSQEDPELAKVFHETLSRSRNMVQVAFGSKQDAEELELTLSTFWGLGLRFLLFDGHDKQGMTDALVKSLFDRLHEEQ